MKITKCICCNLEELELILDLGNQPWCNNFLTKEEIDTEEYYPLQLMCCKKCHFLQLSYFVPKEKMFSKHDYVSGTTKSLREHFKRVAEDVTKQYHIPKDGLIVDIGGNDGTCLKTYKEIGYNNLINVEAASNIAEISRISGIPTMFEFFNEKLVDERLLLLGEKAKIINASGVFFHLEEIHSVLKGIRKLLDDDGVLVIQFMYVVDMLKNKTFDMIYHEHLYYYTLTNLARLIEKYGLYIQDAYHSDIHSGSMIAYIRKKPEYTYQMSQLSERLWEYYKQERRIISIENYKEFAKYIIERQFKLRDFLISLKPAKIYALGAPAKGNTLMSYFGLKPYIQKIHEINDLKIGKYTPGTHIPIEKECGCDLPDYYLVLAHNFIDEMIEKNIYLKQKGIKLIVPFPEIKII